MLNITKHRIKLYELLVAIYSSKYGKHFWFTWWTLAYFLFWLERFSTDLDFDILWTIDDQTFTKDMSDIFSAHATIKDMYNKNYTYFRLLNYESWQMNIKIEGNKRYIKSNKYELHNFYWQTILCMTKECAFANKLIALLERNRTVSRDLFDIHFFFKQWCTIDEAVLQEKTGKNIQDYLILVKTFIKKHFHQENILAGLWELIDNKQKIFVKEQLIQETIWLIDFYLDWMRK